MEATAMEATAMEAPPPPLPPGTTFEQVGSGPYTVLVTEDMQRAAAWVTNLPLLELDPPVKRVIGFSFNPHPETGTFTATFSFFSRVLVLRLGPPTGHCDFPQEIQMFLFNTRNIFVGVGVRQASALMQAGYGMGPYIKMEVDTDGEFNDYTTGKAHFALAQRYLRWVWPVIGGFPSFDVQTSVISQLIGHWTIGNTPWN